MQFFQPIWFYTTVSAFSSLPHFTLLHLSTQSFFSFGRVFKIPHNLKYYKKDTILSNMNLLELRYKGYKGKILTISSVPVIFLIGRFCADCTLTLFNLMCCTPERHSLWILSCYPTPSTFYCSKHIPTLLLLQAYFLPIKHKKCIACFKLISI